MQQHLPHLHFTSMSPEDIFGELVQTYQNAAQRLGYPTSYHSQTVVPGAINILFFFWGTHWESLEGLYPDFIVVNMEPMVQGSHAWKPTYLEVLERSYCWEYSRSNYQRLPALSRSNADWVPLCFDESADAVLPLDQVLDEQAKDIDVVFIGSMSQRRVDLLNHLITMGLEVAVTRSNWTHQERLDKLRRAKIALNFHNWEGSRVVEQSRLHILFRHRCAVVCELYPDSEIPEELRHAVAGASYEQIASTILELLADPARREQLQLAGLEALRKLPPQERWLGPALERYLQWRQLQAPLADSPAASPLQMTVHVDAPSLAASQNWPATSMYEEGPHALHLQWIATAEQSDGAAPHTTSFPPGSGLAARRNYAIQQAISAKASSQAIPESAVQDLDYLAFINCTELRSTQAQPAARLLQQARFLQAHPEIDIVACGWSDADGTQHLYPSQDHHLKAELLGSRPLRLDSCVFRLRFLQTHGLRFDPEFDPAHGELHFLAKCAAAGAHFYALPQALLKEVQPLQSPSPANNAELALHSRLAMRARATALQAFLPHWSHADIERLSLLYSAHWPADAGFAAQMLHLMAKASAEPSPSQGAEQGTLARVLGQEAIRLMKLFDQAGLLDQEWINTLYQSPDTAFFLAPISCLLPLRPHQA